MIPAPIIPILKFSHIGRGGFAHGQTNESNSELWQLKEERTYRTCSLITGRGTGN